MGNLFVTLIGTSHIMSYHSRKAIREGKGTVAFYLLQDMVDWLELYGHTRR